MRVAAALLVLILATVAPVTAEDELPQLVFEGQPRFEGLARELGQLPPQRFEGAMRMVGLERAGAPIRVALVGEDSAQARATEGWVAGYAYGALGRIVLFVERTPRYPDGSLEALLDHEIAHVLVARAAGDRQVPRWFNEGVAMVAGHAWGIADTSRLTLAVVAEGDLRLAEIDDLFAGHSGEVARAYALSGALVRDALRRYGRDSVARVLAGVRLGLPFGEAFYRATGDTVQDLEAAFWRRHSFWYRWVPLLGSSATLWFGITLLALLAFRRRRQRDQKIWEMWEEEDARREARDAGNAGLEDAAPPPRHRQTPDVN